MSQHTATQYVEIIGRNKSIEVEIEISYTFIKGYPATGPSYDCGGEPAEPDSVEIDSFKAYEMVSKNGDGKGPWVRSAALDLPPWLGLFIESSLDEDELLAEVCGEDA